MWLWFVLTTCNIACGLLSCVALLNLCYPTLIANARMLLALRRWFADWRSFASFVCSLVAFRARQLLSRAAVICDKIDDSGRYALTISLNDAATTIVRFDIRPRRNAAGARLVDVVDLDGGCAVKARRALLMSYARYVVDPFDLAPPVATPRSPHERASGCRATDRACRVVGVYERDD
jgi:DNA-directed RNA polymerase subunit K/omega